MNLHAVLALAALLGPIACCDGSYTPPTPDVHWFNTSFDQFNTSDKRTFPLRYLVYDKWYVEGGPILFTPGGEADVYGGYFHNGMMWEFSKAHNLHALFLFPEHRFFGQSIPDVPGGAYASGNIKKLTIEQALEDYYDVIRVVRQKWKVPTSAKLIAFGGSYPGELAAFMRLAAPSLVHGALAASAPVRYHQGILPPVPAGAFFRAVTDVYGARSASCPALVRTALEDIAAASAAAGAREQVSKALGLCKPFGPEHSSLRLLNLWVENAFATLGMLNYPYPAEGLVGNPMNASCDALMAVSRETGSAVKGLRAAVGFAYNASGNVPCFNVTAEYYPCADITGCGGGVGDPNAMSWDYLSCTEVVSNVDTNNVTDMFPPAPYNYAAIKAYCQMRWNAVPNPLGIPARFNITGRTASRIIFSNGELDPWTPGGITSSLSPSLPAIIIAGAAHHLDLRGSDAADPEAVVKARTVEQEHILRWLAQGA